MSTIETPTTATSPIETSAPALAPVPARSEFLQHADQAQPGLVREFWDFLRFNKAWWLTPIIVVLLLVGVLVGLASTGVAPFIYAIF